MSPIASGWSLPSVSDHPNWWRCSTAVPPLGRRKTPTPASRAAARSTSAIDSASPTDSQSPRQPYIRSVAGASPRATASSTASSRAMLAGPDALTKGRRRTVRTSDRPLAGYVEVEAELLDLAPGWQPLDVADDRGREGADRVGDLER